MGIGVATAVVTGALLVGDSMRGSLRSLTLQRLGTTDSVIAPGRFFQADGVLPNATSVALIYFPSGVVETKTAQGKTRRASVQVIGCDEDFWTLATEDSQRSETLDEESVILNAALANELGVEEGDQITLRLPVEQAVPADSPLGRREMRSEGLPRMRVVQVIPNKGLGLFAITASQAAPQNVYLPRRVIAQALQREGQANLLLSSVPVDRQSLKPSLADLGLSLRRIRREFGSGDDKESVYDYYWLTTDRMLLPKTVVDEVAAKLGDDLVQPLCTYLANAIEKLDNGRPIASVPYSTLTAMDRSESFPLDYSLPPLAEDSGPPSIEDSGPRPMGDSGAVPIVIHSWAAHQLSAEVGTPLRVMYYEPEVEDGQEIERHFHAVVTQVVPITEPARPYRRRLEAQFDKKPTVYNDPDLTPLVPGVTDQDSMSDWDVPFELQREISRDDDDYWNNYRLTPKAFIPLADGKRLFGSRFGEITGLRIDTRVAVDRAELENRLTNLLHEHLDSLGWSPLEIRKQHLEASGGTTPFDGLFLSLSSFVIASAILLIAMLVRLGLLMRAREIGTLMATGWTPIGVRNLLMSEGAMVATAGVVGGVGLGVLYAVMVLHGLRTWWVGAVTVPFLEFHWSPMSLILGAIVGWLIAMGTTFLSVRSLVRLSPQTLLTGGDSDAGNSTKLDPTSKERTIRPSKPLMIAALLAIISMVIGAVSTGPAAAGAFVASGMLWLIACLGWIHYRLRNPRHTSLRDGVSNSSTISRFSIKTLAVRNATRNPLRSTLTIGLMASATFLILSISAFHLRPDDSGVGGFELIAVSSQPIFDNLGDPTIQRETFGPDSILFSQASIAAMRLNPGQDAGCNNLYKAAEPTVLGVKPGFGRPLDEESGFAWASYFRGEMALRSPWDLLHQPASGDLEDPIPVILDQNTAMWSLQMYGGISEVKSFQYGAEKPVHFKVVGLLMNSVLQGKLMIGEANFNTCFPEISGYRFFLVDCDPSVHREISETLESRLGDVGMDVSDSSEVLSGMMAVQNTYLRTFQSLGGLGLLLGTIGLAISQLRSVLERKRELAVLRAIGFTQRTLMRTVMSETVTLLVLGIGCGAACAVLAVLPHAWLAGIRPPIIEPLLWIVLILGFGMLAGFVAVYRVSRLELLESLRAD